MGLHFISVIEQDRRRLLSPYPAAAIRPTTTTSSSDSSPSPVLHAMHPASSSNLPPSPSPRHQLALTDERRRWGATEHEDAVDEHPGAMVRGEGADKEEEEAPPTEKKSRLLPSISTAAPPSSSRIFLPSRRSQSPPR